MRAGAAGGRVARDRLGQEPDDRRGQVGEHAGRHGLGSEQDDGIGLEVVQVTPHRRCVTPGAEVDERGLDPV
ncbi:MAG: hypothetical protein V9E83_13070 [Baekduia sp.]